MSPFSSLFFAGDEKFFMPNEAKILPALGRAAIAIGKK